MMFFLETLEVFIETGIIVPSFGGLLALEKREFVRYSVGR
jgi:hypothetical protein